MRRQTADGGRQTKHLASTLALLLLAPCAARAQAPFFNADSAINITIRTDIRTLRNDRDTNDTPWRPGSVTWTSADGQSRAVPVRLRTRGVFRLKYCDFPPVRLRFSEDSVRGTPFDGLRRPKLASYCMDRDDFEQNVLHEYTLYRVLRLFTPLTFAVRLVRVTWVDTAGTRRPVTRTTFMLEDPDKFADRVGATIDTIHGYHQSDLERPNAALLAVWQFFIANTDWSVPGLHNVELMHRGDTIRVVPYDFDWAGAIDARYARPDTRLNTRSVRERVYRGMCLEEADLEPVLARFEALRDSVGAVYRRTPGLDPRLIERTLRYYGEFYQLIADRRRFVRQVVRATCLQ